MAGKVKKDTEKTITQTQPAASTQPNSTQQSEEEMVIDVPEFIGDLANSEEPLDEALRMSMLDAPKEFRSNVSEFPKVSLDGEVPRPNEQRVKAFKDLAAVKAGGIKKSEKDPHWVASNPFFYGALYKNWQKLEDVTEYMADRELFDVPEIERNYDEESTLNILAESFSEWGLAVGVGTAGFLKLGASYKLALGLGMMSDLLGRSVAKTARGEAAPEYPYGMSGALVNKVIFGGESDEAYEKRLDEFEELEDWEKIYQFARADFVDEVGLPAFAISLGMTKRGLQYAHQVNKTRRALNAQKLVKSGVDPKKMEDYVTTTMSSQAVNEKDITVQIITTPEGKKSALVYRRFPGGDVELANSTPPPLPPKGNIRTPKDILGLSPLKISDRLDEMADADILDVNEFNRLAYALRRELTETGQKGMNRNTIVDNVHRTYFKLLSRRSKELAKNPDADTRAITMLINDLDGVSRGAVGNGVPGLKQRVSSSAGVELQRVRAWEETRTALEKLGMDLKDYENLTPEMKKVANKLWDDLAAGRVDPVELSVRLPASGMKGALNFLSKATYDNMLGYKALVGTAIGNLTGVGQSFVSSFAYGPTKAIRDQFDGFMHLLRLSGQGLIHPVAALKSFYDDAAGTSAKSLSGRMFLEDSLPQGKLSKLAHAAVGVNFAAIKKMDLATRALTANTQARRTLGILTDHKLRRAGIKPTKKVWQETYNKTLEKVYKALREGKDPEGYLPLFNQIMHERAGALTFSRDLSKSITPVSDTLIDYKGLDRTLKNFLVTKPDSSLSEAATKTFARSFVIPFSRTFLNMAERTLYLASKPKSLRGGHFYENKERLAQQVATASLAATAAFYAGDQFRALGLVNVDLPKPLTSKESKLKASHFKNVMPQVEEFKIKNRTYKLDSLGPGGRAVILMNQLQSMYNAHGEDNPEVGKSLMALMASISLEVTPIGIIQGVNEIGQLIDHSYQGKLSTKIESAARRKSENMLQNALPLSKKARNLLEYKTGVRVGPVDKNPELSKKMDDFTSATKAIFQTIRNAYGIDGVIQRNAFGEPTYSIDPTEYEESQEGLYNGAISYLLGGSGVVTKEDTEFGEQLRDMGVLLAGNEIPLGEGQFFKDPYEWRPLSRTVSVPVTFSRRGVPAAEDSVTTRMPRHIYNTALGLVGMQEDVWERFTKKVAHGNARNLNIVQQYQRSLKGALVSNYNYQEGEGLKGIAKRIAGAKVENFRDAPRAVQNAYRVLQYDPLFESNTAMLEGTNKTHEEYLFTMAKRKAFVDLYNEMKKAVREVIVLHPTLMEQADVELESREEGGL